MRSEICEPSVSVGRPRTPCTVADLFPSLATLTFSPHAVAVEFSLLHATEFKDDAVRGCAAFVAFGNG